MRQLHRVGMWGVLVLAAGALPGVGLGRVRGGEDPREAAARRMLESARRAYNERNYRAFAAERFREFLRYHGSHKDAASARYGLALALLDGPEKNYKEAASALEQVVGQQDFAERASALYYLGVAVRGLGDAELGKARERPEWRQRQRDLARQHFERAAGHFAAAATAFAEQAKRPPAAPAAPAEAAAKAAAKATAEATEWAARARCDHCEMLLRVGKHKEAAEFARAFLADATTRGSRYRPLAQFHLGYALFGLKDYLHAGRQLTELAPFEQDFGLHARYLLARIHHLAGERPEAAIQYKAVVDGRERQRQVADQALRNPRALSPERRAFLEAVTRQAPPDYVLRSSFYLALIEAETGRFADALEHFSELVKAHPMSRIAPEAQLRVGFCQLQLRNFADAVHALQPLADHRELGDQATWWLARAEVGRADPNDPQAYAQALGAAAGMFRQAAERASRIAQTDPSAKLRRADILLEQGDTMMRAGQHREAVRAFQTVASEKASPESVEEALARQVAAYTLAGQLQESDALCKKFEAAYPKSTLLPGVWLRAAENAYRNALAASENRNLANREQELARLFGLAADRYRRVVERYPEFAHAHRARKGLASACYRLGRFGDAIAALRAIPEPDRTGELASVDWVLADCLVRTLPEETGDALAAARLHRQTSEAVKLLQRFLDAQTQSPEAADALLKLGYCHQRVAGAAGRAALREQALNRARGAYERLLQEFAKSPLAPVAIFERARCLESLGDAQAAMVELNRFRADPLSKAPIAPLALIRHAELLRCNGKAAEAVAILAQCRQQHEGTLTNDPTRRQWVPRLLYEHAVAVKESGKLPEARTLFEALAKKYPGQPTGANAAWRVAQCFRDEAMALREAAAKSGAKPNEVAAARQALEKAVPALRRAVGALQDAADELAMAASGSEPHLRMLYELAWCCRTIGDAEVDAARQALARKALAAARARLARHLPGGNVPQTLQAPVVALSAISLRPAERAARDHYGSLIAAAPAGRLATQARLELAELHSRRDDAGRAVALLNQALAADPPQDLVEPVRLRLAAVLLAQGKADPALAHAQAVAARPDSPLANEARYLAGAAYCRLGDWPNAIKQLTPFRDHAPLQNLPGLSDRALLALGRACAGAQQWDACRQAFSTLTQRFPQSPWAIEALFGSAQSYQQQKNYDGAVNTYAQITQRTVAEVAARALFQAGVCRLEQKRTKEALAALLLVPFTYDYPEWSAAAWCEAGRAHLAAEQRDEARAAWQRVVDEYPQTPWAETARQHLAKLK